jgi:hypothetical protein
MCRHCRSVNLVPGFSRVDAFVCRECRHPNLLQGSPLKRDVTEGIKTTLPHSEFGGKDCRGFLIGRPGEDLSEISCNECGAVLAYIVTEDLKAVLNEMAIQLETRDRRQ